MNGTKKGQTGCRKRAHRVLAVAAAAALIDCGTRAMAMSQTSTWSGGTDSSWDDPTNWSPGNAAPNNGNDGVSDFSVIIPNVTNQPVLDVDANIDSLTVNAGATLETKEGINLTISGDGITDNGTIGINYVPNGLLTSTITITNGIISGTGDLVLNGGGNAVGGGTALLVGAFTQSSTHTISGNGVITATFTNNGTVSATAYVMDVQGSNVVNNGLLNSTSGGTSVLEINDSNITQGATGLIDSGNSQVWLEGNTAISGGTLSGSSTSVINDGNITLNNVTNTSIFEATSGSNVTVNGNLIDNGHINVSSTMTFSGGTLSGNGTLSFGVLTGSLTQSSGHTIDGTGVISASITNNGLIIADSWQEMLQLTGSSLINTSTIQTTSGQLGFGNGIVVNNTGGVILNTTTLALNGATISGGTFSNAPGALIQVNNSSNIVDGLTNTSTVTINNSSVTFTGNTVNNGVISFNSFNSAMADFTGDLVNNGLITENSSYNAGSITIAFSDAALLGTGTVVLGSGYGETTLAGSVTQSSGHTITGYGDITAAITNNGTISANVSGKTLTIAGVLSGTGTLSIGSGAVVALANGSAGSVVSSLVLSGGTLDLGASSLFIDYGYGSDPISSISFYLYAAYLDGWTGSQIVSSAAAANSTNYGIGYADSADPGNPAGLPSGELEIRYTLLGDADLNGVVNGIDFGILAANFNHGVTRWDQGNFHYGSVVNGIDFRDLAANFSLGVSGDSVGIPAYDDPAILAFASANGLLADLPEPASSCALGFAFLSLTRRRSRRQRAATP